MCTTVLFWETSLRKSPFFSIPSSIHPPPSVFTHRKTQRCDMIQSHGDFISWSQISLEAFGGWVTALLALIDHSSTEQNRILCLTYTAQKRRKCWCSLLYFSVVYKAWTTYIYIQACRQRSHEHTFWDVCVCICWCFKNDVLKMMTSSHIMPGI